MKIKLLSVGTKYDYLPTLQDIAAGISDDVKTMVEGYEGGEFPVEVTLDYMHGNILIVGVICFGSKPGSVVFTSLNLWQLEEDNYTYNMQDGKVYGFGTINIKDFKIRTPVQFVEHILHDLFYGW